MKWSESSTTYLLASWTRTVSIVDANRQQLAASNTARNKKKDEWVLVSEEWIILVYMCPPRKTTMATSESFSSVASNIWNALIPDHLSFIPTLPAFRRALKHLLLTPTVVQNLARSNQLIVSHFVIQRQLLPSHSPEIPCRPSKAFHLSAYD